VLRFEVLGQWLRVMGRLGKHGQIACATLEIDYLFVSMVATVCGNCCGAQVKITIVYYKKHKKGLPGKFKQCHVQYEQCHALYEQCHEGMNSVT
jgi:hypothetical protein